MAASGLYSARKFRWLTLKTGNQDLRNARISFLSANRELDLSITKIVYFNN